MRRIIYAIFISAILVSCTTNQHSGINPSDVWADAQLVAEQRIEIERLRNDAVEMGRLVGQSLERVELITAGLIDSLERCDTLEDILREIRDFGNAIIRENKYLRSLQRTDGREDAGEGH